MSFADRAALEHALLDSVIEPADVRVLVDAAAPAVWLRTTPCDDDAIPVGATKLGGRPDLPPDLDWPMRPRYADADRLMRRPNDPPLYLVHPDDPAPLGFLAQVSFTAMAGKLDPDMPVHGVLSLFYDLVHKPYGYLPAHRVGFACHYHPSGELARRVLPPELANAPAHCRLSALSCALEPCLTPIPSASASFEALGLDEYAREAVELWEQENSLYPLEGGQTWTSHRVGGWPNLVQGDFRGECAHVAGGHAQDWMLLLQLGGDGGLMWGDAGHLYVSIRRDDLRARRFDRAHVTLQSH